MVLVAIAPSYGNPDTRKRSEETLEQEVRFVEQKRADLLTPEQRQALDALHPTGWARFWGGTRQQDGLVAKVRMGDVVLFTGDWHIRGIGEIGYVFKNEAFGRSLWKPDKKNGIFLNIYSLRSFQPISYHYRKLWELDGFNEGDVFRSFRLIRDERVADILAAFRISPLTETQEKAARETAVASALEAGSQNARPENVKTTTTSYQLDAREVFVDRAEALLVEEYQHWLRGVEISRLKTAVGYTDLHLVSEDGHEILEAKSTAYHDKVRLAVGQLLDYAFHCTRPVDRLSALFPWRPDENDVAYLHWFGIDCIHRSGQREFKREDAPSSRRTYMRPVWARAD